MKKGTSLYLDIVRFSAAFMVFLEHIREHTKHAFSHFWASHPFWYTHSNPYSQTAVIVFFVLSGYVIAHVLATRENTPLEYAASRLARLYSVVAPALLLTVACNCFIALRYPTAFQAFEANGAPGVALSYLGTALFMGCFWLWPELQTPNTPFWSLSFEASYYVGIALSVFTRGAARILSLVVLALVAGPSIVLLAPTWLLGYGAYHLWQRRQLRPRLALPVWLGSGVLLLMCPFIELQFRQPLPFLRMPDHHLGELLASYAASVCFAANIFAIGSLADGAERLLSPIANTVRWLGSLTFALYLFHQPLLSFFTVYSMPDRSSVSQAIFEIGGTLLVVATLGRVCEQSKGAYKKWIVSLWARTWTRPALSN
jgi:peptidoglycan/LPS O-acetylase OafA/YrhL